MNSMSPVVSIGMPAYNSERWIRCALDAFLAQTFKDFELIVADNCSTDRTYEICREYAARDRRIRVIRNERNVGAPENFNIVFRHSRGRYFKWASSNDLCAPEFLERCVDVLESRPDVVLCYGKTQIINEHGHVTAQYDDDLHLMDDDPVVRYQSYLERVRLNNVEQGLIRAADLAQTKLQQDFPSSDVVLMSELALRGKFFEHPEYLFCRRMAPKAATKLATETERAELLRPGSLRIRAGGWSQVVAHLSILRRVPLTFAQRLRLARYVLKLAFWQLNGLTADVGRFLRGRFRFAASR